MARSVLLLLACAVAAATAEVVDIAGLGKVEGTTSETAWAKRMVYEYRGIQYAKSPSGDLRFKAPVKSAAWTGTRDATQYGQVCPQPDDARLGALAAFMKPDDDAVYQQSRSASLRADPEDCLTLDIYTPTTDKNAKLPVLVYIHGGFFLWGSSAVNKPGYLLEHDVILVSIQYRLGPLGFMYLNDVDAPGNMGLMDQIMALQWVKDHIKDFGGDADKVTIGGFSAGGGSVSILTLSEKANGLFNQVLNQGGSSLGIWAIDETVGVDDSKAVAMKAGCSETEAKKIAACMRGKTPEQITKAYLEHAAEQRKMGILGTGGAMPVIQEAGKGYMEVLTKNPYAMLKEGDYEPRSYLTGVNKHEGIFALEYIYDAYLEPNDLLENEDFLKNDLVATLLNTYHVRESSKTMVDAVNRRYFKEGELGNFERMINGLIDMGGAEFLKSPWYNQCDLFSTHEANPSIFMYGWHYYGKYSLMQSSNSSVPLEGGITHGDDTLFIFQNDKYPLDSYEERVSKRFVQAICNFLAEGNPTPDGAKEVNDLPKWEAFDRENTFYMHFSDEATLMSNYRDKYTVASDEGINKRNSAFATLASPVLILAAAIYHLLK